MARPLRFAAPGRPQHVILRGNNRSAVFAERADYTFFRNALMVACAEHGCAVHAYVLMTNHIHLLATPDTASGISRALQSVGRRYVRRFNDRYQRSGHLWSGRYKATVVETDRYLLTCYRYIELNPVRAGLATTPRDYPWSSHRANAYGRHDALVTPHAHYLALGAVPSARRVAYRALFGEELSDSTLAEIRNATNKSWALGSKRFRDEIAALLGRRVQPATRGRRARRNDEIRV